MLLGQFGLCTYCGGEGANECEHVIPFAYCGLPGDTNRKSVGPQVWSCMLCNQMIGSKIFNSFQDRALYVSNCYGEKRAKYGSAWQEDELSKLSWGLAEFIRNRIKIGYGFRMASDWFNSADYLSNLEAVTCEPLLDKSHSAFNNTYYEFFQSTINAVREYLNHRERSRSAWQRGA